MTTRIDSIIKCPKCNKYFLTPTGSKSFHLTGNREEDEKIRKEVLSWHEGDRKCPYCSNILSTEAWKNNISGMSYEKVEQKQGDCQSGDIIDSQESNQ